MVADHEIVKSVLDGHIRSFEILVQRYEDYAFNLAYRIVKNREEAEEVAQDAFIKAYHSLDSYKGTGKFSSWLYTIVYREAINIVRKARHYSVDVDEVAGSEALTAEDFTGIDAITDKERKELISQAMEELSPNEAAVLTLFYLDEMSIRETSEITGHTESNVKVYLHRGRKNLFKAIRNITNAPLNELI